MKHTAKSILLTASIILIITCATVPELAWSQQVTAAITGQITDPSGAPIADASVAAKDTARGTLLTTETNAGGFYNLPRVPVGEYTIRVEAKGFQIAMHPAFQLELNQSARIDIQLKVGQVS